MNNRSANRTPPALLYLTAICLVCLCVSAPHVYAAEPPNTTGRLLVKVKAPLVKSFESALSLRNMKLVGGNTGNLQVDQFLLHFSVHKASPLYPGIIKLRKQRGLSDLQIATTIQKRFSHRASRLHAAFQPPELSRTYMFELEPALAQNASSVLRALQTDPNVEFAEEEKVVTTNFIPNDPYFSSYGSWDSHISIFGVSI